MVEVVNRQRRREVDVGRWRAFAERALRAVGAKPARGATVAFVSDRRMRELNRQFRGRDYATDVLSFPAEPDEFEGDEAEGYIGDVVVSLERAAAQAAEHGLTFENEVEQLILHGLLHLSGYDHETDEGQMNRLELRLRRRLGI